MKKLFFVALAIVIIGLKPDVMYAQKQIVINSEPADAEVFVDGMPTNLKTPAIIKNPGGKSFTLSLKKRGYETAKQLVVKQKQYNGKNGYPAELTLHLSVNPYAEDPTIKQGAAKEMVSRDNPGNTALERTIIRWAVDSDPQGARVFYRVISSVPAQVKNTNETYLTTTPYEETRSFNILGLTYENSRDVQIEFKIVKDGYETQVKRFNVRQAIDQQEISTFFILVKKEE